MSTRLAKRNLTPQGQKYTQSWVGEECALSISGGQDFGRTAGTNEPRYKTLCSLPDLLSNNPPQRVFEWFIDALNVQAQRIID